MGTSAPPRPASSILLAIMSTSTAARTKLSPGGLGERSTLRPRLAHQADHCLVNIPLADLLRAACRQQTRPGSLRRTPSRS